MVNNLKLFTPLPQTATLYHPINFSSLKLKYFMFMFQHTKKKDLVSTKGKKGLVSTKKKGRAPAICKDILCIVCTNICLASHSSKKGLQIAEIADND